MDEYGLDWYHCEQCGAAFNEFEMNYKAVMQDKKTLCRKCRKDNLNDNQTNHTQVSTPE